MTLRISLLGGLSVSTDHGAVTAWKRKDAKRLCKLLALQPGRKIAREKAIDLLWPDARPGAGNSRLDDTLYTLRNAVETERGQRGASRYFWSAEGAIGLAPEPDVWIDLHEFNRLLGTSSTHALNDEQLQAALALHRGPLLPDDEHETWTLSARLRVEQQYIGAMRALAKHYIEQSRSEGAIRTLQALVQAAPSDEQAHADLLSALAHAGRIADMHREYAACRALLEKECELEPSEALQNLYRSLCAAQGETPLAAVPPPQPAPLRHRAPAPLTPLIGRAELLERVCTQLRRPELRLITLIGMGGIGKTQLAIHVANAVQEEFPHGCAFISLSELRAQGEIAPALCRALDVPGTADESALIRSLADKHLLLVLDNLEQLGDGVALLSRLLAAAPKLKVLATSRAMLRLTPERVIEVPPLALAEAESGTGATMAAMTATVATTVLKPMSPAVKLFVERARAVDPDFALTPAARADVEAICNHLAGIPLAIELAAVRVNTLGTAALYARLRDDIGAINAAYRDLPERHRSLEATLEWSYRLLDPAAQRAAQYAAVFSGGLDADTFGAVCSHHMQTQPQVAAAALQAPIEHHLVIRTNREGTSDSGNDSGTHARYTLLEPVREFLLSKLAAAPDATAFHHAFAEYWTHCAEGLDAKMRTQAAAEATAAFAREHGNFRNALRWAVDHDATLAYRLAAALAIFWAYRGYLQEGEFWLSTIMQKHPQVPPALSGRVLHRAGVIYARQRKLSDALPLARAALEWAEAHGGPEEIIDAKITMGSLLFSDARRLEALEHLNEGLRLAREMGDLRRASVICVNIAGALHHVGRYSEAALSLRAALTAARISGHKTIEASATINLVENSLLRGEFNAAEELCMRSVEAAQAAPLKDLRVFALANYAETLVALGKVTNAMRFVDEALGQSKATESPEYLTAFLTEARGVAALMTGQAERGAALLARGRTRLTELALRDALERADLFLSVGLLLCGDLSGARKLLEPQLAQLDNINYRWRPLILELSAYLAALDGTPQRAQQLKQRGAEMRRAAGIVTLPAEEVLLNSLYERLPRSAAEPAALLVESGSLDFTH